MLTLRRLVRVGRSLAVLYSRVGVLRTPVTNAFIFFIILICFFSGLAVITITMHLLVYNGRFNHCIDTLLKCSQRHHTRRAQISNRNTSKCLLALRRMKTPRSLPNLGWCMLDGPLWCSNPCIGCSNGSAGTAGHVFCTQSPAHPRSYQVARQLLHRLFCTVPNHIPLWEKN